MFIRTQETPNPHILKFVPGQEVMGQAAAVDFPDADAAKASPLAEALFRVEGVERVLFGGDFISVTRADAMAWQHLKPPVMAVIMEHLVAGLPVHAHEEEAPAREVSAEDAPVAAAIEHLLEERVRPAVARDGGDIVFHGYANGVVHLRMRGACAGCPASAVTLKQGIERLLKHFIPEVREVREYQPAP